MKRTNDCILENSLKFKIYGECYSAEDIYIQNQETLSIVSDLIGRIKTLEKLIEPPRTVYRTIWVDKKSNGILYRATTFEKKPRPGWIELGYDGWYYQDRRFGRYYTRFETNPYTRYWGKKYWVFNESEFKKRFQPEFVRKSTIHISMAEWYKRIKK